MTRHTRSFDQGRFREVLGHFATGITIVTAMEDEGPVGFTCQSFTSLSLDPALIALAPAKTSTSWPKIAAAGAFCVNILSSDQEALCRTFAASGADKFAGVGWSTAATGADWAGYQTGAGACHASHPLPSMLKDVGITDGVGTRTLALHDGIPN